MRATQQLHELSPSTWFDNVARDVLTSGALKRYITDYSSTALTAKRCSASSPGRVPMATRLRRDSPRVVGGEAPPLVLLAAAGRAGTIASDLRHDCPSESIAV